MFKFVRLSDGVVVKSLQACPVLVRVIFENDGNKLDLSTAMIEHDKRSVEHQYGIVRIALARAIAINGWIEPTSRVVTQVAYRSANKWHSVINRR
jgi:hypothetical protein